MALFVAEVEEGLGCLSRITVCPEGIKVGMSVNRAAGIGVIALTI